MALERRRHLQERERLLRVHPVVAILGSRQCGKTTLARVFVGRLRPTRPAHYFDFEDTTDLARLDALYVLFPGRQSFPLGPKVRAVGLDAFLRDAGAAPRP